MDKNLAFEVIGRHDELVHSGLAHVAYVLRRNATPLLHNDLAAKLDLEGRRFTAQALRHELHLDIFL